MMKYRLPSFIAMRKGYAALSGDGHAEDGQRHSTSFRASIDPYIQKGPGILLIITLMFVSGIIITVLSRRRYLTDKQCTAKTSVWCRYLHPKRTFSREANEFPVQHFLTCLDALLIRYYEAPLLDVVEYKEADVSNHFSQKSAFRGPPTPEIEQNWLDIYEFPSISIPASKVPLLNRTADTLVPAITQSGYLAGIEVFHQLHCLNIIRQYTWLDHYASPPPDLSDDLVRNRIHVDHCIETLRLALTCNAELTPYFALKSDNKLGAKSDFNSYRKCKKFDGLVEWMKKNSFVQPVPGQKDLGHHHEE